ncbi:MAG TPA: hypothetical protein VI357_20325 [Mycobacteriales bacterium]
MTPARVIAGLRALLILAGLGLLGFLGWGDAPWWATPTLAVALAATDVASARLVIGRHSAAFLMNDAVLAIALVLDPGGWIAVGATVGFALARARQASWSKLSFNMALEFFGVLCGVLVAQAAGGTVFAACLGLGTYVLVNALLVAIPITLTTPMTYLRVLEKLAPLGLIQGAGNLSIGVLAGWLLLNEPLGLLALVVPIGLLWWSYQQQSRRTSEAQLFAELAQGQQRLGGSVDASAQVITIAAARLFGASQVEMLLRHPDGLLRYVGDESGVAARIRVDADALDGPWALRALAARGVLLGVDGDQPYCSAVLGDPERPQAVLIAHRPARAAQFTRAEAQLAGVLVAQAESWLSVAELSARRDEAVGRAEAYGAATRVLGDISQETVPALAVLRESAHRLSRLATRFEGPEAVDEIVAELYSVERAVASLLGAIALASDSAVDQLQIADAAAPARTEAEWTTTGRFEDAVGP